MTKPRRVTTSPHHDSDRSAHTRPPHSPGRVCVVGDIIADRWCSGVTRRLAREAPVPVLELDTEQVQPGGAANTAANLAALGVEVDILGWVGRDSTAAALLEALRAKGVGLKHVREVEGAKTPAKSRFSVHPSRGHTPLLGDEPARGHEQLLTHTLLRVDTQAAVPIALPAPQVDLSQYGALLVCDYGGGGYSAPATVAGLMEGQPRPLILVDSHQPAHWLPLAPDIVTPNWQEASREHPQAADLPLSQRRRWVLEHSAELLERWGARYAIVTLDVDGTLLLGERGQGHWTGGPPVGEERTCGAGDSFAAGLTAALLADLPLWQAQRAAQAAAESALIGLGTATCQAETVWAASSDSCSPIVAEAASARAWLAAQGLAEGRITLGNGIFDDMHSGHDTYLHQAGAHGDTLVVGVNTDASVQKLRGTPKQCEAERAQAVAQHPAVDLVVLFDDPTAEALIEHLRPSVYVKGGDYTSTMVAERDVAERTGTQLETLDYLSAATQVSTDSWSGAG